MTNLSDVFTNHKALIPFVIADDPDFDGTVANVVALANAGADIVELGIPFSDPVADGPVIQAGDLRAFKQAVTPAKIFDIVAEIRKQTQVPLVFLTYINIPFKYGYEAFCKKCQELGVSGLVVPDLPYESRDEIVPIAEKYDVDIIPLITPTSADRIPKIAKAATGFIYMVSSLGVTGTRESFANDLSEVVQLIRANTDVPVAVGFGIHTPDQAREMAQLADGAIVGSAMVKLVEEYGREAPEKLADYAKTLRNAIDSPVEVR